MSYSHTQIGTATVLGLASATLVTAVVAFRVPEPPARTIAGAIALLLVLCTACFSALRVEVDRDSVRIRFGLGWPARRVPLERIAAARRVRNRWWYGWGIRFVPGGWMWNVGGLDAVELVLQDGRRFRIGTDEPERLHRAIESARARRSAGA